LHTYTHSGRRAADETLSSCAITHSPLCRDRRPFDPNQPPGGCIGAHAHRKVKPDPCHALSGR
jgi:hypothetical protein